MPSRIPQDIAENPRITSTECAGLSRGSLDSVNLGRLVSKSRTRVLIILSKPQTLESHATSWQRNAGQGRVAVFPLVALLAPSWSPVAPPRCNRGTFGFYLFAGRARLIVPARKLIDRQSPPCVSVRLRRVDRGERALDIGLDNGSVPECQDLLRKPLSTSDAALGATSAIRSGNESLGGGPVCATRSRARGVCRTGSILLAAPAGGR